MLLPRKISLYFDQIKDDAMTGFVTKAVNTVLSSMDSGFSEKQTPKESIDFLTSLGLYGAEDAAEIKKDRKTLKITFGAYAEAPGRSVEVKTDPMVEKGTILLTEFGPIGKVVEVTEESVIIAPYYDKAQLNLSYDAEFFYELPEKTPNDNVGFH